MRDADPPQPSSLVSGSHSSLVVAERRGQELRQLRRSISGDLDRVTMKALDKDPNRRYETALGFAADLERYLKDEPVLANPPSQIYRMKRFIRRHVGAVVAAALAVIGLAVGSALAFVGMIQAQGAERSAVAALGRMERAEKEARREEKAARDAEKRAKLSKEEAEKQAKLADQREQEAIREGARAKQISDALASLFVAVDPVGLNGYTSLIRKPIGQQLTPVDLLRQMTSTLRTEQTMDKYVKFSLLVRIAVAAMNQSEAELAESAIRHAEEIAREHFSPGSREMAEAVHYSASIEELNGRYGTAEQRYREALALRAALLKAARDPKALREAKVELSLTQLTLSLLYSQLEDFHQAEDLARKGLASRLELFGPNSKETAIARMYLAICLVGDIGVAKKAEAALLAFQAKQFFEKDEGSRTMVRAVTEFMDGVQAHTLGLRDDCLAHIEESMKITEKIVGNRHPYYLFVSGQLGSLYADHGRHEEAYKTLKDCLQLASDLRFLTHPKLLYAHTQVLFTWKELGKQAELEEIFAAWIAAHERADRNSQFYADALLLAAQNDIESREAARAAGRIELALKTLSSAPVYGGRATTRLLLQGVAQVANGRREYGLAKKVSEAWVALESRYGKPPLQAEARYQELLARLGLKESGTEVTELLDQFEREGKARLPENRFLPMIVPVLRSRECMCRGALEEAEACLALAEARARDAQAWYLIAVQAARIHRAAPSGARLNRVVADLRKAIAAGYRNREVIEREPEFEELRALEEFQALVGAMAVKSEAGSRGVAGQ